MATSRIRSCKSVASVVACTLVAFAGVEGALGQSRQSVAGGSLSPSPQVVQNASRSRIDAYARILGLDADQTSVARDLYDAMTADLARQTKKTHEAMAESAEDHQAGDHTAANKRLAEVVRAQSDANKKSTQRFLDDLKALLRPEQAANWEKFEQFRRRENYLRGGSVGGSGVDLFRIVDQMKLSGEVATKAAAVLDEYAPDIDRVLKDRERVAAEDEKTFGGVQHFDEKSMKAHNDRDRAIDLRVREVNQKHLRLLAAALPEDLAKQLDEQYQLNAYRQAYRKTSLDRTLAGARNVQGLSDEQKRKLDALVARYAKDSRAAGDRLASAIRKAEDAGIFSDAPMMIIGPGGNISGQKDPDDVRDARASKRDLEKSVRDDLSKILTPEQIASIPKPAPGPGQRVEVHSMNADDAMVFVSDVEEDDLPPPGAGGGGIIVRTVEVHAGGPSSPQGEPPQNPPKPD